MHVLHRESTVKCQLRAMLLAAEPPAASCSMRQLRRDRDRDNTLPTFTSSNAFTSCTPAARCWRGPGCGARECACRTPPALCECKCEIALRVLKTPPARSRQHAAPPGSKLTAVAGHYSSTMECNASKVVGTCSSSAGTAVDTEHTAHTGSTTLHYITLH